MRAWVVSLASSILLACSTSPQLFEELGGRGGSGSSVPDSDASPYEPDAGARDGSNAALDGAQIETSDAAAPKPPPPCVCDGSTAVAAHCKATCKISFEALFADGAFPAFYLTIPDDNGPPGESSWDLIAACTQHEAASVTPPPRCEEQLGSFHAEYDPEPGDGVNELVTTPEIEAGIRRKGRASFRTLDEKPSFKVKFTAFGGERFMGLTTLTLNNMVQDPSGLRERLAYRIFHDAGVHASLAGSARVFVRRNASSDYQYYGVYANVQSMNRRFLEYHFGEVGGGVGNLYDTYNDVYFTDLDRSFLRGQAGTAAGAQEARFQLETNEAQNDKSDLTALLDAVYAPSSTGNNELFVESIAAVLDVDAFLTVFAVQALITDWDGFAGARNNYKVYRELGRQRFLIFPWGLDQTFGYQDAAYNPNWNYALDHQSSNRASSHFMKRCIDDASDCYARYRLRAAEVIDSFDAIALLEAIDTWESKIRDAMLDDTRKEHSNQEFERYVLYLRHYVETRDACFRGQLTGPACGALSCPQGSGSDCKP